MKKRIFFTLITITTIIFSLFAFNWPLEDISSKNIKSYFGQFRGNTLSSSLVFTEPEDVKAIGDGTLLIQIIEDLNTSQMFPSTLGNAILLSHNDNLVSVYGNLEKDSINIYKSQYNLEEVIAKTGNSGYQTTRSNLEFQIFDSKQGVAINPKVLMPRTNNELPLAITNISLQNKKGELFSLTDTRNIETGTYKVYIQKQSTVCPYKTKVSINGVEIDSITFDTIYEENSKVYINGKKQYLSSTVYPNNNLLLVGEAVFTPGRINLGIELENILGEKVNSTSLISVY